MNPLKALYLAAILTGIFVLAFACSDTYHRANAQPNTPVYVSDGVKDSRQIQRRIETRLKPDDEIQVVIVTEGAPNTWDRGNNVLFLYAEGKEVTVTGNDWVPQVWLDERLDRIDNVTRRPVDQIVRLIDEIHAYQEETPRSTPPPPPPPPPGPPPPPPPPKEPLVINWLIVGPSIGGGLLVAFLIVQAVRRKLKRRELARRAEEQMDWGYDKYGIKSSLDLDL